MNRWLLLFYQVPPRPAYLRVRIGRRLAKVGALAVKPTVYVLPKSDGALEDFQWVARELSRDGGEATVCEARLVEGLRDEVVVRQFNEARAADYREVRAAAEKVGGGRSGQRRLQSRLAELAEIDFFGASGRREAEQAVARIHQPASKAPAAASRPTLLRRADYQRRTWVTRKGIHVDRIACSWLIRRFVDPHARLKFVAAKGYVPSKGELRFDMFDGEFTHEGDACSFETLLRRFGLSDPGLRAVAEIVHDIDLKDAKFGREEGPGVDRMVAGLCMTQPADSGRLDGGRVLFDSLYGYFQRKLQS